MAQPEGALREQLAAWFATLDPTVQQIFDAVYAEAPEAVSRAFSGGEWVAAADDPPLLEVLGGAPGGVSLQLSGFEVVPWPTLVARSTTIRWTLQSGSGQPGYRTELTVTDPNGEVTLARTLDGDALPPGGTTSEEIGLLPQQPGVHVIELVVNPDGAPQGQPPNANGTRIDLTYELTVMTATEGDEAAARTRLPEACTLLAPLVGDQSWEFVQPVLVAGLGALLEYCAAAGVAAVHQDLVAAVLVDVSNGVLWIDGTEDDVSYQALVDVGTAAQQQLADPDAEGPFDDLLAALHVVRSQLAGSRDRPPPS